MSIPIAVQLYSVRNECAADFMGALGEVAEMGYAGVEFAGTHGFTAAQIAARLKELGLKAEGAHVGIAEFEPEKLQATLDFYGEIECPWLIIPWMPEEMRNSPEACAETAKKLTELSATLIAKGFKTGFHAHDGDMKPLAGGKSAWDLLAEGTPKEFMMQYDTANGMHGGADPVQPILDHPGRSQSLHLKEYHAENGFKNLRGIGEGSIPWAKVFEAAESVGGTEWYVVEHESDSDITAMQSIDLCLKNLRAMGK
ncbi:MAG: sugar phosphate isomerase/epimerase [Fimbriimonadaceae bacterium]|nr:sugar phosphate isomerase/epimerase [Fimbriimonadaceae bacterium]